MRAKKKWDLVLFFGNIFLSSDKLESHQFVYITCSDSSFLHACDVVWKKHRAAESDNEEIGSSRKNFM